MQSVIFLLSLINSIICWRIPNERKIVRLKYTLCVASIEMRCVFDFHLLSDSISFMICSIVVKAILSDNDVIIFSISSFTAKNCSVVLSWNVLMQLPGKRKSALRKLNINSSFEKTLTPFEFMTDDIKDRRLLIWFIVIKPALDRLSTMQLKQICFEFSKSGVEEDKPTKEKSIEKLRKKRFKV